MKFASNALGEKIPEEKLARKMLSSLPKRFDMKVTAIEEAQDIYKMKMDELVGSLLTLELSINERYENKNKSIAFVSNIEDEEEDCDLDTDVRISNALAMLGRQFNKVIKRMGKNQRSNVKNIPSDIYKSNEVERKRAEEKYSQGKGIQHHEYEGFGHWKGIKIFSREGNTSRNV